MTIPVQPCRTIIKETTGLRVGESTSRELATVLEEMAETIAERAGKLATHSGRQTVSRDDVLLAVEMLEEE